jgi:hypothetical protein
MGHTIKLVEDATAKQFAIVYNINIERLNIVPNQKKEFLFTAQNWLCSVNRYAKATRHSQKLDILITLNAVPGTLIALDIPLLWIEKKLRD